jgi:hypothetical protein
MRAYAFAFAVLFPTALGLLLPAAPLTAQTALTTRWTWPGYELGYGRGIAVRPPYAYLASAEAGLHILDIANPARPLWMGNLGGRNPRFSACDVVLSADGSLAYVARPEGLEIIQVSDPAKPETIATLYEGEGQSVTLDGSRLYLAAGSSGLFIIDISDPSNPQRIGHCPTSSFAFDVAIRDTFAYVADAGSGVSVIDLADPTEPRLAHSYLPEGVVTASSIVIRDHLAYLSDSGFYGLRILDLTQPRDPRQIGSCLTQRGGNGLALTGNLILQAAENHGLRVMDVSNPTNPVLLGTGNPSDHAGYAIALAGERAYVADYWTGLLVFDFAQPAQPALTGSFNTSREILEVQTRDSLALVAAGDYGLALLDLNSAATPTELGHLEVGGRVRGLAMANELVLLAAEQAGLLIVDVEHPAQPKALGRWNDAPPAFDVAVMGRHAIVAGLGSGVHVIDFSDPTSPQRVGGHATAGEAYTVAVTDNLALVGDHGQGLVILDLTQPSAPVELAVYPTQNPVLDIRPRGSVAYLLESYTGVEAVDIHDPRQPRQESFLGIWGSLLAFELRQTELYLAADAGIQFYDVTDWANPQYLDYWAEGPVVNLLTRDRDLLVCRGFDGLSAIERLPQPDGLRLVLGQVSLPDTLQLVVEGTPGQTIEIQRSTDLRQWDVVGERFLLEGSSAAWIDPAPPASPHAFYRASAF